MDPTSTADVSLNWIDLGCLAIMLALAVAGAFKGAIRIVMGFVTMSAAWWLSGRFGGRLGLSEWSLFRESDLEDPRRVATLVECGLLFAAALIVGALVARLLRKAAESVALGGYDRLLALLLGLAMGALVSAASTVALMAVDHQALWPVFESSLTVSVLRHGIDEGVLSGWIDGDMRIWLGEVLAERPV